MIKKLVTMVSMRTNFFILQCMGIVRCQDSTSQQVHILACRNGSQHTFLLCPDYTLYACQRRP